MAALAPMATTRLSHASERTLKIVAPSHLIGLDPTSSGYFIRNLEIGETLLNVGPNGRIDPGLATDIVTEPSGLVWKFPIASDRLFHDGGSLTAEAAAMSLGYSNMRVASPLRQAPIRSIAAEGNAVVVTLSRPYALLPAILASAPSVILSPTSYDRNGDIRTIIASGPYRLIRFEDGERLETAAVRSVAEGGPSVQRVLYQVVDDSETRARMVEAGDAHIALTIMPVAAARLRKNTDLSVISTPNLRLRYVMVNAGHPALGDVRVRRALSLSMDRAGAARTVLRNPDSAATQMVPPILPEWSPPGEPQLRFDPDEAEQLLDEAGWHRDPETGIREREGKKLSFELLTYAFRPELSSLSQVLQAQWRKIGIDTRLEVVTAERIVQSARNGTLQLALFSRNYFLIPNFVANLIDDFVASSAPRGWGAVGWRSDEISQAIQQYVETTNANAKERSRTTILRILHDELPIIPHSWYESILVHSKSVTGVEVDPFETSHRLSRVQWA